MTRFPDEYKKQWRLKQGKSGLQKQKEKDIRNKESGREIGYSG